MLADGDVKTFDVAEESKKDLDMDEWVLQYDSKSRAFYWCVGLTLALTLSFHFSDLTSAFTVTLTSGVPFALVGTPVRDQALEPKPALGLLRFHPFCLR